MAITQNASRAGPCRPSTGLNKVLLSGFHLIAPFKRAAVPPRLRISFLGRSGFGLLLLLG